MYATSNGKTAVVRPKNRFKIFFVHRILTAYLHMQMILTESVKHLIEFIRTLLKKPVEASTIPGVCTKLFIAFQN